MNSPTVSAPRTWRDMRVAVVAITAGGARLGRRLCENMAGCELLVSRRYADPAADPGACFEPADLKKLITSLWETCDGLALIMATGIVVRMIAPLLTSKETDPAVVVMDDAGSFAISLLSGHLGGGNELAAHCAAATGAQAVITTATDANNLPSFDMLAKEQGWIIENIHAVKTLNRLLLDHEEIAVVDPTGQAGRWLQGRGRISFHETLAAATASTAHGCLLVTNRLLPQEFDRDNLLILRPRNLTLGIGCNRGTPADEIEAFVMSHLTRLCLSPRSIRCIASVAAKRDEAGLAAFAQRLNVPLRCFASEELQQVAFPSPPSHHALTAVGVAAVAEPAAILASGGGKLLLNKVKSANVTLAIAECKE